MKKRLSFLLIVLILIIGGWFYLISPSQHEDKISQEKATALIHALKKVNYIEQGLENAPHKLYAVVDPNCAFCHALFQASQSFIKQGQLAVRWIVVGVVKPSSPTKAMTILNAPSPLKALKENEQYFNDHTEKGGIQGLLQPEPKQIARLDQNIQAMRDFVSTVPAIIYLNRRGHIVLSGGERLKLAASPEALKDNQHKLAQFLNQIENHWAS